MSAPGDLERLDHKCLGSAAAGAESLRNCRAGCPPIQRQEICRPSSSRSAPSASSQGLNVQKSACRVGAGEADGRMTGAALLGPSVRCGRTPRPGCGHVHLDQTGRVCRRVAQRGVQLGLRSRLKARQQPGAAVRPAAKLAPVTCQVEAVARMDAGTQFQQLCHEGAFSPSPPLQSWTVRRRRRIESACPPAAVDRPPPGRGHGVAVILPARPGAPPLRRPPRHRSVPLAGRRASATKVTSTTTCKPGRPFDVYAAGSYVAQTRHQRRPPVHAVRGQPSTSPRPPRRHGGHPRWTVTFVQPAA
jgi:hypothetical protein